RDRSGVSGRAGGRLEEFSVVAKAARLSLRVRDGLRRARTGRLRAAFRARSESIRRRVRKAVSPSEGGRARLSRDAVSGVPEEDQSRLRSSAAMHRILRSCRQLRVQAVKAEADVRPRAKAMDFRPLRRREYRLLFTAQAVSIVGS